MSYLLKRTLSGLIYQEDFDNTDPWTQISGIGTLQKVDTQFRFNNTNQDYWYINTIDNLKNSFIQLRSRVTYPWGYMGPSCRMVQIGQDIVYAYGHWERDAISPPRDYDRLYQRVNGDLTALVNYGHEEVERQNALLYDVALWTENGNYQLFYDCDQGGHTHSGSDCTQLATDRTGLFMHAPGAGEYVYITRYNIMTSKNIICSALPTGWKLRVNEDDNYKEVENNGTATVDCFPVIKPASDYLVFPVSKIEILDANDVVQNSFESSNNIWGGDRYVLGRTEYDLDKDALAFKDLCRIDVDGVPGEWF